MFIGPYEHHSNELPWRESIADVVVIDEDSDGKIDLQQLEAALQHYQQRPLLIGSFSAASNVTGIGSDTRATAALLHRYGALSFWDFAAAGPYVQIEMNMADEQEQGHLIYKDAVFLSPHKFIGGPGTPGVLVAKKALFTNMVPTMPGGGTVSYVSYDEHRYLDDLIHREEGGTPAIIESIRAGLVFQLKEAVGWQEIRRREESFVQRAVQSWGENPNIRILGNDKAWRLSIVSFIIRHNDKFLHHNFVVALLNDLLGIQARGGCSCAGPYGHRLLDIDITTSKAFEREIVRGCEGVKPGWIRVNFNYFISETVFDFMVKAVHLIANDGWKLLVHYSFDPQTGAWHHRRGIPQPVMRLSDLTYEHGTPQYRKRHLSETENALSSYLEQARVIISSTHQAASQPDPQPPSLSKDFQTLRWFSLPEEARQQLLQQQAAEDD